MKFRLAYALEHVAFVLYARTKPDGRLAHILGWLWAGAWGWLVKVYEQEGITGA